MNRRLAVVWAVLLKDLRLFWPVAALAAAAILASALYGLGSPIGFYLPITAVLISGLFFLGLIHQDAPASLRHDWLTRPIRRIDLLLAKAVLAGAVILLPAILGAGIAAARDGAPVGEALLLALAGAGNYLFAAFVLLLIAAVTSTLLEAAGVLVALILLGVLAPPLLGPLAGSSGAAFLLGYGWVIMHAIGLVLLAGGVTVLWLQYAQRRTAAARGALGATVGMAAVAVLLLNWGVIFAVQRAFTRQAPEAEGVSIALAPGCFEAASVDPIAGEEVEGAGPWTSAQLRAAGPGAVAFWTAVRAENLPAGWRMATGHVEATYVDADGRTLAWIEPSSFTPQWRSALGGQREAHHPWLLSRTRYDELANAAASLRLDYKLALLRPAHTAEIAADGQRRNLPGIGSCAATANATSIEVICFKAGLQPDLLVARLAGGTGDQEAVSGPPDFAPDLLQRSTGERYRMTLPLAAPAASTLVTVTAFEATADMARSVTAPGVLGGPAASCPTPEPA